MEGQHKVIDWIESKCLLGAKSGPLYRTRYKLLPWQKELLSEIFHPDGSVKTPNAFLIGAKKTGKTDFAKLVLAWRFFHPERFGELHTVSAMSHHQASFLFDDFAELCELSFAKEVKIIKDKITHRKNKNIFQRLYQSKNSAHGIFPNGISAFDELGVYDTNAFAQMKIIEASMGLSYDPQMIYLANLPEHEDHYSLELLKQASKSKDWVVKRFQANRRFSWKNPKAAVSANPFLEEPERFPQLQKWYEKHLALAKKNKQDEVYYKRYGLGLGTILDNSQWISPSSLGVIKNPEEIYKDESIRWAIGVDLSVQGGDSTSWVCVGMPEIPEGYDQLQDEGQGIFVYGKIYYTTAGLDKKPNHIKEKILQFEHEGHVTVQRARAIQQRPIIEDIYNFLEGKPFRDDVTFVFDPSWAQAWIPEFQDEFRIIEQTYSPKYMSRITRIFQRKSQLQQIHFLHEGNRCARWHAACGQVNEQSRNWCLMSRLNKNFDLNVDYWTAALLAGSDLIEDRGGWGETFVA